MNRGAGRPHGHGVRPTAGPFASLIGLYTVAAYTDRWRSLAALAIGAGGIAWFAAVTRDDFPGPRPPTSRCCGWPVGSSGSTCDRAGCTPPRSSTAEELRRTREQEAREAVASERRRIAGQLHDLIGHTVNLMVVQAGAGRRMLEIDRDRAGEAFETIESTGRTALSELDRLLNVLRPRESDTPAAPQPSLGDLGRLAERFTASGSRWRSPSRAARRSCHRVSGSRRYRIVQEALTNCLKHTGAGVGARGGEVHAGRRRVGDHGQRDRRPTRQRRGAGRPRADRHAGAGGVVRWRCHRRTGTRRRLRRALPAPGARWPGVSERSERAAGRASASEPHGDGVWGRSPRRTRERAKRASGRRASASEPHGDGVWGRSPQEDEA